MVADRRQRRTIMTEEWILDSPATGADVSSAMVAAAKAMSARRREGAGITILSDVTVSTDDDGAKIVVGFTFARTHDEEKQSW